MNYFLLLLMNNKSVTLIKHTTLSNRVLELGRARPTLERPTLRSYYLTHHEWTLHVGSMGLQT